MEQELDASDIRACGGFLPVGRTGLASGTLAETAAGATGRGAGGSNAAGGEWGETLREPPTPPPPAAAPSHRWGGKFYERT